MPPVRIIKKQRRMTRSFGRTEQSLLFREASFEPSTVSAFSRSDSSSSEGYDKYFDPPLESKYECPICLLGLREPVQTTCGHRFCKGCILRSIRDAGPKCPVDDELLHESQLFPDNFAKRELLSHNVYCPQKKQCGCPWKGPLSQLEEHLMIECDFVELDCPNECGRILKRKDLKKHSEEVCPNRTAPCRYCQEQVKWNGLEEHFEVSCLKFPQTCDKCGQENIPRDMIDEHLEKECPNTEIKCPFHIVGCSFKGLRANVNQHVMEQLTGHLTDMSKKIVALSTSRETEPQTQQTAPRRTRDGLEARPQEQAAYKYQGERNELMRRVCQLEEIVTRLHRSNQWLRMRFNRYEAKLLEYEGRVCNGSYIWRIENYRQCRQNAIDGVMTALHSPAFYTSLYGYKFCMRMHLNGIDRGVGQHLALYVQMMQGDYDALLEWPFKLRKVEFTIVDQSDATEVRHHISRSLEVNPYVAFQRPSTTRNQQVHGYAEFASIARISERQYVKNNTMLVHIQIFH